MEPALPAVAPFAAVTPFCCAMTGTGEPVARAMSSTPVHPSRVALGSYAVPSNRAADQVFGLPAGPACDPWSDVRPAGSEGLQMAPPALKRDLPTIRLE